MVLLVIPAYFAFSFTGGLIFSREPFPGYSFFPPLVVAILAVLMKLYMIHVSARLLQGRKHDPEKPGRFSDLKVVFGYTGVPAILAIMLAMAVFLSMPREIGYLMRDLRTVAVSIMVALAIALFVWNLILVVLAMRTVYGMGDMKLVGAFILGSALMWIPGVLSYGIIAQPRVDSQFVEPILSERILKFFSSEPASTVPSNTRIAIHVERMVYALRLPERFELVAYRLNDQSPHSGKAAVVIGKQPVLRWDEGRYALGRIIGMPGDTIELSDGRISINGQIWQEPYITPEYQAPITLPAAVLAADEFFILPDNRHIVDKIKPELIVSRDHILGRQILSRWPLGWWTFRPSVFYRPSMAPSK
jgi:signal peptidase I